jgi:hypothetical protein
MLSGRMLDPSEVEELNNQDIFPLHIPLRFSSEQRKILNRKIRKAV